MAYIRFVVICHINSCANLWTITSSLKNLMYQQIKAGFFFDVTSSEKAIWANKISGQILQSTSNYLVCHWWIFILLLKLVTYKIWTNKYPTPYSECVSHLTEAYLFSPLDELKNKQLITDIPFLLLTLDECSCMHDVIDRYLFHFCK